MSIKNFQLQIHEVLNPVIESNNYIFNEIYKYIKDMGAEGICDVFEKNYILIDDLNISLLKINLKEKITTIDIFEKDVIVLFRSDNDATINKICFDSHDKIIEYINKLKQKIKKWNS